MHIIGPACSVACVRAGLRVTMRCEQRAFCSAQLCVSGKPFFSEDPLIVSQLRPADNFRFLDNVSDHTALEFRLNVTNCQKTQAHTESHYDFRRADVFLFKSLISAVNWEFILCNTAIDNSIDSMLAIFYETFWSICNKCVPIIASGRKNNIAKYPSFIVKLDSKCKRLSKRKNTQPNGMHKWRAAQNDYMLAIQQFVYNRESTILQSGDSAAFYRYVNERRVHKDGVAPLLNEQGEPAVSDREKTHILITQFTSVFTIDNGNLPDIEPHTPIEISDINFTPELVRKFMCKLLNKFSRSPDGIPSAVLKMLSYELCQPLYFIFKKSLHTGTCPSIWKLADITPVFKKGDASIASNYRPISIIPAMCRLFERILVDNINHHMHSQNLFTDAQYGFVKGRSTEIQLLNCTEMWINSIDKKMFTDTVYIDFAKAFDTVSHPKLLHKLQSYGISGNILKWFTSFLKNRKQRVKIGTTFSEYDHVTSGVPQGSCAGPILFILFANDLPDCNFYRNTVVSLFADDTKISTTFSSIAERPSMQNNLNEFINWATKWQLQIADHKCCVQSHGKVIPPVYHINGIQLPNVNEFRDLGVIVDSHCIFKQHILQICRKAYVSINVIFRCFHSANVHALLTAYRSFVRPTLEYCSTVWNPALSARHYLGLTDALERVQRYFTRRVYYRCKLDSNHDYLQRLVFLNLESLQLRRTHNDLIMVYKIIHGHVNINADKLLHHKSTTSAISTRGHGLKLKTCQFKLDVAKNHFSNRVVSNWNNLPEYIVTSDSIIHFKKALRTVNFESSLTFNRHL